MIEEGRNFSRELAEMQSRLLEEGSLLPEEASLYLDPEELLARLQRLQRVNLSLFLRRAPQSHPQVALSLTARQLTPYNKDENRLAEDLLRWYRDGYTITLRASTERRASRLRDWLRERLPSAEAKVVVGAISQGFEFPTVKAVEITDSEIFGQVRRRERRVHMDDAVPSFTDLKVGDLVVHLSHGIGRYLGVETLDSAGVTRDYMVIELSLIHILTPMVTASKPISWALNAKNYLYCLSIIIHHCIANKGGRHYCCQLVCRELEEILRT